VGCTQHLVEAVVAPHSKYVTTYFLKARSTPVRELPQADRFSDDRDDNPYWNESVWFSFSDPGKRIHGFVQYYVRPNMGMLNGGPVMWDPSGTFQWNCLYYNWSHLQRGLIRRHPIGQ
jgi:hypothetical protein